MGTTAAESLNAAACIFIGFYLFFYVLLICVPIKSSLNVDSTEAAVLIRTSLPSMTDSEIMASFTAGFSSISGSLFAAYISFGACPLYLLSANVMSAPATLAIAKIMHPETQKSRQKNMDTFEFPKRCDSMFC